MCLFPKRAPLRGSLPAQSRWLALFLPLWVFLSAASAVGKAGLAVTTQQRVQVGEAIKFQW